MNHNILELISIHLSIYIYIYILELISIYLYICILELISIYIYIGGGLGESPYTELRPPTEIFEM